ncbi:MAG: hypothetical protein JNL32_12510, partial [Candidatus Kapabacteria bacterium]|nr:hypothetical protein [Candidatus Kapabacteria bacterium]
MKKLISLTLVCCVVALALTTEGCRRKREYKMPASNSANTKLWKKYETPPGADPSVADTAGGAGFEKIAEKMGFVTYSPKEDELKYFGDSRAKTGGEIRILSNQFPATFRPEGQNSSSVYNQEVKGTVYEGLLSTHPLSR